MSYQVLLSQNKILAYFTLDSSANVQENPILEPCTYPIFIFHHHYPIIYYHQLFQHFQHCLPKTCQPGNIRIFINKKQLPSEVPIGLFLADESAVCFTVGVDEAFCVPDAFRVIRNSWKKAFEIVNSNRRCDYVKTRLSEKEQKKKFNLYCEGLSHNFQNEGLYQGNFMIVKGFFEGEIIERKFSVNQLKTMGEVVKALFCVETVIDPEQDPLLQELNEGKEESQRQSFKILSHGIAIDMAMSSKKFLDQWSYNDGYCYLKLVLSS